jgi:hypothetical protein
MIFKMFHKPKPRQFSYKPIYYDPDQEKRQQERDKYGDLRSKFRDEAIRNTRISSTRKNINITIYLVVIALLIYFIFFS